MTGGTGEYGETGVATGGTGANFTRCSNVATVTASTPNTAKNSLRKLCAWLFSSYASFQRFENAVAAFRISFHDFIMRHYSIFQRALLSWSVAGFPAGDKETVAAPCLAPE